MSLLAKLLLLAGMGCIGLWGYFHFQSNAEKVVATEEVPRAFK